MVSAPLIFYLVLFLVGALGSATYLWKRNGARHSPSIASKSRQIAPEGSEQKKTPTGRHSGLSVNTEAISAVEEPDLLVSSKKARERKCPKCSRVFHESLVICPHDQTPLRILDEGHKRVVVRESSNCPTCVSCSRRYEHGVQYCRHDGKELSHELEKGLQVFVCRNCGSESPRELDPCCDFPNLVDVNPGVIDQRPPLIPMLFCPLCHYLAPSAAQESCPNDATHLLPMLHLARTRLAPLGEGPRRKICPHCSRKYSKAGNFCAFDGHKLVSLD